MVFGSAMGAGCVTGRRALVGVAGLIGSSALIESANRADETGVALRLPLPRESMRDIALDRRQSVSGPRQ